MVFLSTLSLRRATIHYDNYNLHCTEISIHALLAESDSGHDLGGRVCQGFLSTLSWRRATTAITKVRRLETAFLSTLSLRRATQALTFALKTGNYFYPRSPCGERPIGEITLDGLKHFYPRSPCGERRIKPIFGKIDTNFYPRSPCGERLIGPLIFSVQPRFLSTLSLRRATHNTKNNCIDCCISIHALLAESDIMYALKLSNAMLFLSTLSLRRATDQATNNQPEQQISIHALLAESDCYQRL